VSAEKPDMKILCEAGKPKELELRVVTSD
jgi:hypothetical protein